MSDRLYLSIWLKNHSAMTMPRQMAAALRQFPFSTQAPQVYLRVSAVDPTEPALLEQAYELPDEMEELVADLEHWRSADSCFELEGYWDLWQERPEGWRLWPSRVNLFFQGPAYPSDEGEAVRVELGLEEMYVPEVLPEGAARYYQSNIQSLLRLSADWASAMSVAERRLWSESPGSLEGRLQSMLGETAAGLPN